MTAGRWLTLIALAARDVIAHPSWTVPALVLLLPTLILQLTAATYLRTRLAPAMWTVAIGSVVLIWWTQVATPIISALVHRQRTGAPSAPVLRLARVSLAIGTSVALGLALAVLPGLWLQARYAFAPLLRGGESDDTTLGAMRASAGRARSVMPTLTLLVVSALAASALAQGAVAVIAEAMGTITPVAEVGGRTIFELHYLPHAITSMMAYLGSVAILTIYAAAVSAVWDGVRGVRERAAVPSAVRAAGFRLRVVQAMALALFLAVVAAFAYKVQQHI
jgi:hypothetical protein